MSHGYTWHQIFRQTPQDGAVVLTDTRLAFPQTRGPVRMRLRYSLLGDMRREDVNHRLRPMPQGFRMELGLVFELFDQVYQEHLANIVNRMRRPYPSYIDGWTTELSIDAGGTYNEVALIDFRGPDAIQGKTIVGSSFELAVSSVEPLDEVPRIAGQLATPLTSQPLATLPPATVAYKWQHRVLEGAVSVEDQEYVCLKTGSDTYAWIPTVSGGP